MADCKPLSTPIFHGVTLCRDDCAKIVDETPYKITVKNFTFLSHTRPNSAINYNPTNKYC